MASENKMGPGEWVMLIVLAVVWGGAFFFYKILDEAGLPPFTIVFGRVALAALVLMPVVVLLGKRLPHSPRMWGAFLLLGAINNVIPFALIILGEKQIDSGLASIFNATTPIFAALIAHAFTRTEKIAPSSALGIVLGLFGVALLMGPTALHGINLTSLAQLACIAAAITYGVAVVYARHFRAAGVDPMVVAAGQLCGSALLTLPLVFVEHPAVAHLAAPAWWAWIGLAIPGTALAFVLYFRILATAGATNAASVTFLVPVFAVLLGTLVLGEHLAPTTIIGMIVIFTGLATLDGRIVNWLRVRRPQRVHS
jgi:drug/metabolite transporter (DMT)-like permease